MVLLVLLIRRTPQYSIKALRQELAELLDPPLLAGLEVIVAESWPKAIHEGNGTKVHS
jgi:hypothetical protein